MASLVLGLLALVTAVTYAGGVILGVAAIIVGFFGVAKSRVLDARGESAAVAGIITGMFGMALAVALSIFLT